MNDARTTYLGPLHEETASRRRPGLEQWVRKTPKLFLAMVVAPTVVAVVYYLGIASPRYVSEAQFIVRSPRAEQPSSLGVALQGVGIPTNATDAFAVHEYIRSQAGLRDISRRFDVRQMYGRPGIDMFSRLPGPWRGRSFDDLYSGFKRYLTVGYDSTTGISTLRVEAFRAADAQALADAYLDQGEILVNRLNARSAESAEVEAQRTVDEARGRLANAQTQLTDFRNREGSLDPGRAAVASSELVGALNLRLADLQAERSQIAAGAPASPQLPSIDSRIQALSRQIAAENARMAGSSGSLAPKIGRYESLILEQEMAGRNLAAATSALETARLDRRRQQLYLERVVEPTLAEEPSRPQRLRSVLAVLLSSLVAYGTIWLVLAGLKESKQDS